MSRCDERLKARVEESTWFTYTGLHDKTKLEIPNDKEEVNTREIHKCDGQAHDPDTIVAPLTPKPTRKAEALAKNSGAKEMKEEKKSCGVQKKTET